MTENCEINNVHDLIFHPSPFFFIAVVLGPTLDTGCSHLNDVCFVQFPLLRFCCHNSETARNSGELNEETGWTGHTAPERREGKRGSVVQQQTQTERAQLSRREERQQKGSFTWALLLLWIWEVRFVLLFANWDFWAFIRSNSERLIRSDLHRRSSCVVIWNLNGCSFFGQHWITSNYPYWGCKKNRTH